MAISDYWRRPGRRNTEREAFSRLMREVERVRLRYGMTKTELAAELGANVDGVRAWMSGRSVGRKETVAKIEAFLIRKSYVASIGSGPSEHRSLYLHASVFAYCSG